MPDELRVEAAGDQADAQRPVRCAVVVMSLPLGVQGGGETPFPLPMQRVEFVLRHARVAVQRQQRRARDFRRRLRGAAARRIVRRPLLAAAEEPAEIPEAEVRCGVIGIARERPFEPGLGGGELVGEHVRHAHVVERVGVAAARVDDLGEIGLRARAVAALQCQHAHEVGRLRVRRVDAQRREITVLRRRKPPVALVRESGSDERGCEVSCAGHVRFATRSCRGGSVARRSLRGGT